MIYIAKPEDCSGCSACVQICPKNCISFEADAEGFCYPAVDKNTCIDCSLCEKTCPVIGSREAYPMLDTLAAFSKDAGLRLNSSSGGVFGTLARKVLSEGGVVYGVKMDDDCKKAVFARAETLEDLPALQGSKYIQSYPLMHFSDIRRTLQEGRRVLFSGTPCQVNGLLLYLGTDYENLMTMDTVCHGVPSPALWERYMQDEEQRRHARIRGVSFRDKTHGWKFFGMKKTMASGKTVFTDRRQDDFFRMFLRNYCLRPSCYDCKSKKFRMADITTGDFWGIDEVAPAFNDDRGVSSVIVRTQKGRQLIASVRDEMETRNVSYDDVIIRNHPEYTSVARPPERERFFKDMQVMSFARLARTYVRGTLLKKIRKRVFPISIRSK